MIDYDKLDAEIMITMYNEESEEFNDELYSIIKYKDEYYFILNYLPLGFYLLDTNYFSFERISLCKFKIKVKEIDLSKLEFCTLTKIEKIIVDCITESENEYLRNNLPIKLKQKINEEF